MQNSPAPIQDGGTSACELPDDIPIIVPAGEDASHYDSRHYVDMHIFLCTGSLNTVLILSLMLGLVFQWV